MEASCRGSVTLDENGTIYDTTIGGEKYNYGPVWKIAPQGRPAST